MDSYIKERTDMFLPMEDIYSLAQSGKGAKFLTLKKCREFVEFLNLKKSAVTTAEHSPVSPEGTFLNGYLDFFWEQKLPQGETWKSFYDLLNGRFLGTLDAASKDMNSHYFQVWAGMKGDESHD